MIVLDEVSLKKDGALVLAPCSMEIKAKERVVILGASGSGKTTLLRLIAGFVAPSDGRILLEGVCVSQAGEILVAPRFRDVSMVFQDLALWPHMSVGENIAFALKMQKVDRKKQDEKVQEMLEMVSLSGYAKKRIFQLSGGEQQRVALARALVLSPKIVLMDEPLSSLDKTLRAHLSQEIVRLQEKCGFTLLYVTHDEAEAAVIATKTILMEDMVYSLKNKGLS